MAASSVLRIHSETVLPSACAARATFRYPSGLKRTGTIVPLAVPLGSFGRPGFRGPGLVRFAMVFEPLDDCGFDGGLRRYHGRNMKDRDMPPRLGRIASFVHPCVDPIGLWMPLQKKDFNNPIPDRFPLKGLRYWNAFQMAGLSSMEAMYHVAQLLNMSHAVAASTNWPTVQNEDSTPAAIAGVQRVVLCRSTRL